MNQQVMEPTISVVDLEAPARWLFAGWADFKKAPAVSVVYGLIFVIVGYVLIWAVFMTELVYLAFPLTGAFILSGPFMTLGLYEVSRRLEMGEKPTFCQTFGAWKAAPRRLGLMAVALVLVLMFWMLLATVIFGLAMGSGTHTYEGMLEQFTSSEGFAWILVGSLVGLILSAIVFLGGAVSFPMLLEQDVEPVAAIQFSACVVLRNSHVMWSWAFTIAIILWFSISVALVGLIVSVPVLGYATWHAYRDLVKTDPQT